MKVILIVDMVKGFVEPTTKDSKGTEQPCELYVPGAKELIPYMNAQMGLLDRDAGDQIIFVSDSHQKDDVEFKQFPPHCIAGSQETNYPVEFNVPKPFVLSTDYHMLTKTRFSAFFDTTLQGMLDELLYEKDPTEDNFDRNELELVVMGVCTEICILHTVADARMLGYKVVVPERGTKGLERKNEVWAFDHMWKVLGANVQWKDVRL